MQDDQDKPVDELTLAGNPSTSASSQPSDPAPQAAEEVAAAPPTVEGEPPALPGDSQPEAPASSATGSPESDDSLDPIKKEALKKLEPLVNELDLHPEEKYRALMMIIQATDNKDLVNEAYQAADKIEDNKTRAQALLSIVNEIEYFKNKEIASSE